MEWRPVVRGVVHGVLVDSAWDLPHLTAVSDGRSTDLEVVRLGSAEVDEPTGSVETLSQAMAGPHRHRLVLHPDGSAVLTVPGVLTARIDPGGSRAEVSASPRVREEALVLVVGGLVVTAALLVRGCTVVHAGAAELDGRAVAIIGGSGAGKSTVTGMLCLHGGRLMSDDQLRVAVEGGARCWRSARWLRARETGLGPALAARIGSHSTPDGRRALRVPTSADGPAELVALVVPVPDLSVTRVMVQRVRGIQAVMALSSACPLPGSAGPRWERMFFEQATALAAAAPVYTARVPWRPNALATAGAQLWDAVGR